VENARRSLKSQFEAVARPTPLERMGIGLISPMTAQPVGTQLQAKKFMKRQTKPMRTIFKASDYNGEPTIAMIDLG